MKKNIFKVLIEFLLLNIGLIITTGGLVYFLIPNKIVAGGVSGIATLLYYLFNIPIGITMIIINTFLILIQFKLFGKNSSFKTIYAIIFQSFTIDMWMKYTNNQMLTTDNMLASLFGGLLCGIGMGLVLRNGGTTGGTDILALIVNRIFKISIGISLTFIDFTIAISSGFLLGKIELALYGIITIFFTSKIIDIVLEGFAYSKIVFIISKQYMFISELIMGELERGVTKLDGIGMYTGDKRPVLMVVINRKQLYQLKNIVASIDKNAFMVIAEAHQVLGLGFQPISKDN